MHWELFWLFAAYTVSIPWWHTQNYYYAHNKGRALMWVTISSTLAGLLLWLLAIRLFGVMGVYVGFAMQMCARTVGAVSWARRSWEVRVAWPGTLLGTLLLLIGAMICAALAAR
jgi:O-antigen/teichoic acid export membrane protein